LNGVVVTGWRPEGSFERIVGAWEDFTEGNEGNEVKLVRLSRCLRHNFEVSTETPEDELLQPQSRRVEILESFYAN